MRRYLCFVALLLLMASLPALAQKVDPLTGEVVEQAPPPEPEGPDFTDVNAKIQARDFAAAEAQLAEMQEEFPEDVRLLGMRGELLVALGRHGDAIPVLEKAVELAPDRPRLNFHLGTALASSGKAEEAIAAFGMELEHSEETQVRLLSHLNRSMLFQRDKNWPEAASELEAAVALDPSQVQGWGDLILRQIEEKDLDAALATLKRGADAGFRSSSHYYSVGARLFKQERFAEASATFTHTLEIEPTHSRAVRSLAASLEKLGQREDALEQWARYLELAPEASDADQVSEKLRAAGKL